MHDDMSEYFSGRKLYGDDFTLDQLKMWYEEEREGYTSEVLSRNEAFRYPYHELHRFYGFNRLELRKGAHALGLGSAYGHELLPVLPILGRVTILDPSSEFAAHHVLEGIPVTYLAPRIDGVMDFPDNSFDLITCFGVLHHIANVSKVLAECYRCLIPGGVMLCQEPIVAQGDWRRPRPGLTKNERGIPLAVFDKMVRDAGFLVERKSLFDFSPFVRLMHNIGLPVFANPVTTRIDSVLARVFSFNTRYFRVKLLEKIGPASAFFVLRKVGPSHSPPSDA